MLLNSGLVICGIHKHIGQKLKSVLHLATILTGSVEHYYKPRWHSFINALNASMHSGIPFNSKKFKKNVMKNVEIPFTLSNYSFPSTPTGKLLQLLLVTVVNILDTTIKNILNYKYIGDSLLEAKRIYGKWNIVFSQLNTKMRRRRKHQNR